MACHLSCSAEPCLIWECVRAAADRALSWNANSELGEKKLQAMTLPVGYAPVMRANASSYLKGVLKVIAAFPGSAKELLQRYWTGQSRS
jgi:hypothetical protein